MSELLTPAPLRRRYVAGLIDLGAWFGLAGGYVLVLGAVTVVPGLLGDDPGTIEDQLERADERVRWVMRLFGADVALTLRIGWRGRRSPGARRMGLRTVDARTGGPVRVRSIVIEALAPKLLSSIINDPGTPWQRRQRELLAAAEEVREAREREQAAKRERAQHQHKRKQGRRTRPTEQSPGRVVRFGDPESRSTEVFVPFVNPWPACLPGLAVGLIGPATAALSSDGRSVYQRLAGTRVVMA